MAGPANFYFIRRILYQLKKEYGGPITIYEFIKNQTDAKTGIRSTEKRRIDVNKAVLLPTILSRKFTYDLSYIAANKNFTYGGLYDLKSRIIIVDSGDLPPGIKLEKDDYVVIENQKFDIKTAELLEHNYGYLLTVSETIGALPYEVIPIRVGNVLKINQVTFFEGMETFLGEEGFELPEGGFLE